MKLRYLPLVVLGAVIIALAALGPEASATSVVIDDFDDNSIGDVWTENRFGTGGSVSETNLRVEFDFKADSREGPPHSGADFGDVGARLVHECKVTGDFDVQVDFDVAGWPKENGVRIALLIDGFSITRAWDARFGNKYYARAGDASSEVETTDTSGTLRLSRMDSTVAASYKSGGGWQEIVSGTGNEDPASLVLRAWTHNHLLDDRPEESEEKAIKVSLDNLMLEEGNLTCAEVDSIEFTQAIQELQTIEELQEDLEDDGQPPVPMIAGKPAVMRVYFDDVNVPTKRTVKVSGDVEDSDTVTLSPLCDPEDRREQKFGCEAVDFYFTPPEGEWEVGVSVYDDDDVLREHYDFKLESVEADAIVLKAVSVCDEKLGGFLAWECEDATKLAVLAGFLRIIAPTDEVTVEVRGHTVRRNGAIYADPKDWWTDVVQDAQGLHDWIDSLAQLFGQQRYYFGMVRPSGPDGLLGKAAGVPGRGGAAKSATATLGVGDSHLTTAHEIGHMLGVKHTNTGNPSGSSTPACWGLAPDDGTDWPYDDNNLRSGPALASKVEVGFDVVGHDAIPGDEFLELMGYCNPQWISPRTYLGMLNALGGTDTARASGATESQEGQFWLLSGEIAEAGVVFRPLYEIDSVADTEMASGPYRVEVRAADDGVLLTRLFTPIEISAKPEPGEDDVPSLILSELIPVQEGAARIVVIDGSDQEIGAIELGGEVPVVSIDAIGGGGAEAPVEVSWSVEDSDSTEHTYWVDYSPDGGETWQNQGMGLVESELGLDPAMLAGSDDALIRVLASDGVNTGTAVSEAFSVAKKLPEGEIFAPESNTFHRVGELVWLQGFGFDRDDGSLDDGDLNWSSSRDGALGTGSSLPVYDLSVGTHTITMTAEDSDGNETSDSIMVTVVDTALVEGGTIVLWGDANCSGSADPVDSLLTLRFDAGLGTNTGDCPNFGQVVDVQDASPHPWGDVDCGGEVTPVDSLKLLRFDAGLSVSQEIYCPKIGSGVVVVE